jgi:hypothetical protein
MPSHRLPRLTLRLALMAALTIVGCQENHQLDVAPVRGKVLLDGQPLPSGVVFVMPSKGRSASGMVQEDGTFELTTYSAGDGAQLGKHPVMVTPVPTDEISQGEQMKRVPIPRRYGGHLTSGLSIEVSADRPNEPVLELSSKSP